MTILEIILIALGLSMDCFAVAISFGTTRTMQRRDMFRTALFFGLFQGLMPVIGWIVGIGVKQIIAPIDHWIAFLILVFIGLKMIIQAISEEKKEDRIDIRKTAVLLSLSVATSIDALITGITFGFINVNILLAATMITLVTFVMTILGVKLAEKTTFIPGRMAEIGGGVVLIGIGTRILLEHMGFI